MRVRFADRFLGVALALLLQAGFLFLLLQAVHRLSAPPKPARELTLILPRFKPAPRPPAPAPARSGGVTAARPAVAQPAPAPPAAAVPDAGALRGLGRSLFGCAPENYAALSPEDRAHCPKPGENAPLTAEDALNPKSHSKDAATWQEDLDERHFDYGACVGAQLVITCQLRLTHAEQARAKIARDQIASDKAKREAVPPPGADVQRRLPATALGR